MGRKPGTEVGVNSSFVALIATESVSIAIPWPLLPPEVGVNRHGQFVIGYFTLTMIELIVAASPSQFFLVLLVNKVKLL